MSREFVLHVVLVDVLPVISALLERPVVGAPRDEVQLVRHQDLLDPPGPQVVTGDVLTSVMLLFRVVCSHKPSPVQSQSILRSVGNSQVDSQIIIYILYMYLFVPFLCKKNRVKYNYIKTSVLISYPSTSSPGSRGTWPNTQSPLCWRL